MSQEPTKIGRRSFINYLVAIVATGVIVGAGMYIAGPKQTVTETVRETVTSTVPTTITITGTPTTITTTTIPTTTTPTTTTYPQPPEPKEPIKLSVWMWDVFAPVIDGLNKIAYIWNKEHPKVQIEFTAVPGLNNLEFALKVEQATMAGQGPDIIQLDDYGMPSLLYDGYGEVLPPELQDLVKKYVHPNYIRGLYSWGPDMVKRMYMVPGPYGVSPAKHLWINEYHLQEAGLDPNWYPSDWDELINVAQKLTKYDSTGKLTRSGLFVRIGGHVGGIFDKFLPLHRTAGGKVIWAEGGQWKTDLDSDIAKKVIQRLYLDVMYKYHIYEPGFPGDTDAFAKELVSMVIPRELREAIISIQTLNPDKFWGPEGPKGFHGSPIPPENKGGQSRNFFDQFTFAVNSKSPKEKKDWAFAFLAWYMSDSTVHDILFNSIGNWTSFIDVMNSPPFNNAWYQQLLKVTLPSEPDCLILHPLMGQINVPGGKILSQIFLKELDLDTGLKQLGSSLREIINQVPAPTT
jgi:ABC-type glycerol-3-phosphate transport system substrate-binding protein